MSLYADEENSTAGWSDETWNFLREHLSDDEMATFLLLLGNVDPDAVSKVQAEPDTSSQGAMDSYSSGMGLDRYYFRRGSGARPGLSRAERLALDSLPANTRLNISRAIASAPAQARAQAAKSAVKARDEFFKMFPEAKPTIRN